MDLTASSRRIKVALAKSITYIVQLACVLRPEIRRPPGLILDQQHVYLRDTYPSSRLCRYSILVSTLISTPRKKRLVQLGKESSLRHRMAVHFVPLFRGKIASQAQYRADISQAITAHLHGQGGFRMIPVFKQFHNPGLPLVFALRLHSAGVHDNHGHVSVRAVTPCLRVVVGPVNDRNRAIIDVEARRTGDSARASVTEAALLRQSSSRSH